MTLLATSKTRSAGITAALAGVVALAVLAVINHLMARRAERRMRTQQLGGYDMPRR